MRIDLGCKTVFVTGSSSGLGFEIAKFFQMCGANILLNGRDLPKLKLASETLNGTDYFQGDLTVEEDCLAICDKIKSKYDKIDHIICNVGSGKSVSPGKETLVAWRKAFDLNFWSAINSVHIFSSLLEVNQNSSITCLSSICGIERIEGAPITYSVAKSALNSFINSYAPVLAKKGIRLNAVVPGNLMFENSSWEKKLSENLKGVQSMLNKEVPLKRFGSGEEVSKAIAFLASENANFVTGSLWKIDGGQVKSF